MDELSLSMDDVRDVEVDDPPRILIYAPEKMGKTTLAAQFPGAIFLQTERGESRGLKIKSFGHIKSFQTLLDAVTLLITEEHPYRTAVLDSVTATEKLVWAEVCRRNNWASIEQPGYGKGYVETDAVWGELIAALNYLRDEKRMNVVIIGHATVTRFDDPETQSYSQYAIDLHKRADALLKREVDAILLIKKDVTIKTEGPANAKAPGRARAEGGDTRWIYCQGRPAFVAGNRYRMPAKIMFPDPATSPDGGYAALAPFLPCQPAPVTEAKPSRKAA